MIQEQNFKNVNKKKTFLKNQTEILELKNTMTELNNLIESFKSQLDQARRKKNGELKDRPIEMINQRSRKKTTKRNEESL